MWENWRDSINHLFNKEGDSKEIQADDVLNIHKIIEEKYDIPYKGLRKSTLDLKRIVEEANNFSEDPYKRIAKFIDLLKRSEIFEDGNKRTTYTYLVYYLEENNLRFAIHESNTEPFKVVTHIGAYNVTELENWIRGGEIDDSRIP